MNLQNYYIDLLLNTLSPEEHARELIRLKCILGAHPKPKRSDRAQMFVDFVRENVYAGNTGKDLMKKKFNIKSDDESLGFWMNKTGLSQAELQSKVNAAARLAGIKIRAKFKEHESLLLSILA